MRWQRDEHFPGLTERCFYHNPSTRASCLRKLLYFLTYLDQNTVIYTLFFIILALFRHCGIFNENISHDLPNAAHRSCLAGWSVLGRYSTRQLRKYWFQLLLTLCRHIFDMIFVLSMFVLKFTCWEKILRSLSIVLMFSSDSVIITISLQKKCEWCILHWC